MSDSFAPFYPGLAGSINAAVPVGVPIPGANSMRSQRIASCNAEAGCRVESSRKDMGII
ncbi:MAG TPA: hypothetical protein VEI05_05295 [Burkholderiaceae bacterium]|nr:hypothetical protein [Burkholderiaceae bacterium]